MAEYDYAEFWQTLNALLKRPVKSAASTRNDGDVSTSPSIDPSGTTIPSPNRIVVRRIKRPRTELHHLRQLGLDVVKTEFCPVTGDLLCTLSEPITDEQLQNVRDLDDVLHVSIAEEPLPDSFFVG